MLSLCDVLFLGKIFLLTSSWALFLLWTHLLQDSAHYSQSIYCIYNSALAFATSSQRAVNSSQGLTAAQWGAVD